MSIKVTCGCGKQLAVKEEYAGRQVKCPACQKPLRVPQPAADEETDDEPASPPVKSRKSKASAAPGKGSKKGKGKKKSAGKNRGFVVALSVSGVLVAVLLAWMLWPRKPADSVAVTPSNSSPSDPATTVVNPPPNTSNVGPTNVSKTPQSDFDALQGVWQFVAVEASVPPPPEELANIKLMTMTIEGDSMKIKNLNNIVIEHVFTLDPAQSPKSIDLVRNGMTVLGIYSLDGDTLKLAMAKPDTGRPMEMNVNAASRHSVSTFKRIGPVTSPDATKMP